MGVTVSRNCFSGKQQALEAIGTKGLVPRDGAMSRGRPGGRALAQNQSRDLRA